METPLAIFLVIIIFIIAFLIAIFLNIRAVSALAIASVLSLILLNILVSPITELVRSEFGGSVFWFWTYFILYGFLILYIFVYTLYMAVIDSKCGSRNSECGKSENRNPENRNLD